MERYGGYSEPIEVLLDILVEQKRTNELLEKLMEKRDEHGNELENTTPRKRRNGRGSNNAE